MGRRIRVAITVVAVAAGTALFIGTPGAVAIQSQPVLAGAQNTANFETLIVNENRVSLPTCLALNPYLDSGLVACGYYGVQGLGSGANGAGVFGKNTGLTGIGVHGVTGGTGSGVFGEATANGVGVVAKSTNGTGVVATALNGSGVRATGGSYGVYGTTTTGTGVYGTTSTGTGVYGSTGTGTGVVGVNFGATGIGVNGKTFGSGSAVYGESINNGVAVFGKSTNGTALRGDSPNGTALQVNGKAKFSRSGVLTLAASASSITKTGVPLTAASYVLATLQTNTLGLFIQGAVPNPAGSSITIYFSKAAPIGTRVAWFVVN
jgi:hypothetical protein